MPEKKGKDSKVHTHLFKDGVKPWQVYSMIPVMIFMMNLVDWIGDKMSDIKKVAIEQVEYHDKSVDAHAVKFKELKEGQKEIIKAIENGNGG